MNLPGYSPDVNADEASWRWVREEATGNLCLGSRAKVQEMACSFLAGLAGSKDDVKRRCRTVLQSRANALMPDFHTYFQNPRNAHPTLALVYSKPNTQETSIILKASTATALRIYGYASARYI